MEKYVVSRVTKESSDGSFCVGDIIYISKDGVMVFPFQRGQLEKGEWDIDGTNDFVAVPASEYSVVRDTHSEYIERIN